MIGWSLGAIALMTAGGAAANGPAGLHEALTGLASTGKFSGAVVIRDAQGVRFAAGFGLADPFNGRRFTPETPVDSGSLAKPVTAAAVLTLAQDGLIELDAPARRYLPELPYATVSVRQLLSHTAGLPLEETPEYLAGKSNRQLIEGSRGKPLLFPAGSAFSYCNLCTTALAEIVERVSGTDYLAFARTRLDLPSDVELRPARLADWTGRAIGFRRRPDGKIDRFDSWEGEQFYGSGNLSVTAAQLAGWGVRWWRHPSRPEGATRHAVIAGKPSGLTLGNWYCAKGGRRCHYLGHHEGFHHMLYWDADRKLSIAMVSNNAVEPGMLQRLQRAIVAFSEDRAEDGRREAAMTLSGATPPGGRYRLSSGESVEIRSVRNRVAVRRAGIDYPAYQIGPGIRYVPGLDLYFALANQRLQWLTLYEDKLGTRIN